MIPPRRTLAEWKSIASERLGGDVAAAADANGDGLFATGDDTPPPLEDAAGQTAFESPTRDVAVATAVSTADLSQLLPLPDAATLLRSSLPSLRGAEREVSALLQHVQRDIALYMHHAGVAYDRSNLDTLEAVANPDTEAPFAERRTLRYTRAAEDAQRAAAATAALDVAQKSRAKSYAAQHDNVQVYGGEALRRAKAMEHLRREVEARHEALEGMDRELQQELEASRQRLTSQSLQPTDRPVEELTADHIRKYALGV